MCVTNNVEEDLMISRGINNKNFSVKKMSFCAIGIGTTHLA